MKRAMGVLLLTVVFLSTFSSLNEGGCEEFLIYLYHGFLMR